ncbi:MAG: cupin domain-containing protein [Acidobacteria bacterium]|nr:MAG: cupin domain-containing protein [Acidobacteriota bacterium]REJ99104.1 MAG: cupin domain-containing protein [Acidobacteriota bacterium]REK16175.1 MAG: cupin domain-containing protein [Acidobacteriota bacterium]REK43856.1 MAG: cupin domain-containing protein [Acidobacteriota bacterium]
MAVLSITEESRKITDAREITKYLSGIGIEYERWDTEGLRVGEDASEEKILEAYSTEIDELKRSGGYVTADVIDVSPETPGLDDMLAKFNKEHWHDEDEVRYIVKGHGLFHISPEKGPVVGIEMEAGDLIRVPKGTLHWFDLCADRTVRAIRLFQDPSGWTPHYTDSRNEDGYQPLCFSAVSG